MTNLKSFPTHVLTLVGAFALTGCGITDQRDGGERTLATAASSVSGQSEKSRVELVLKQRAGAGAPEASTRGLFVKKVTHGALGSGQFPAAWIVATGAVTGKPNRTNGIFYCQSISEYCVDVSAKVGVGEKNGIAAAAGPNDYSVYYSEGTAGDVYRLDPGGAANQKIRTGFNRLASGNFNNISSELWLTSFNPWGRLLFTTGGDLYPSGWYARSVSLAYNAVPWIITTDWSVCTRPAKNQEFSCMSTQGSAIAAGRNNPSTVWLLGKDPVGVDGDRALFLYHGGKWIRTNAYGKELAVDEKGYPWIVNGKGQLFQVTGYAVKDYPTASKQWYKIADNAATDIGAGPENDIWISGNDLLANGAHTFRYWAGGSSWPASNGTGYALDVAAGGLPWVIGTDRKVYRLETNRTQWARVGDATAWDIGVGMNGSAWSISFADVPGTYQRGLRRLVGTQWVDVAWPHGARALDVGPTGVPWVVSGMGEVFEGNTEGTSWTHRKGLYAVDIGIGADGSVYVVSDVNINGLDKAIYRYSGGDWTLLNGGGTRISVHKTGSPYLINSAGAVYTYNN